MDRTDDVKIAGFEPEDDRGQDDLGETESIVAALYRQKMNGNLDKARTLGQSLAGEVMKDDGAAMFESDDKEGETMLYHRRLLFIFSVSRAFSLFCENNILEQTARNSFFETLKKNGSALYENIRKSGDFSYYLLCVRDCPDIEECIGLTFAELIGHKEDETYASFGRKLYRHFLDVAAAFVNQAGFAAD